MCGRNEVDLFQRERHTTQMSVSLWSLAHACRSSCSVVGHRESLCVDLVQEHAALQATLTRFCRRLTWLSRIWFVLRPLNTYRNGSMQCWLLSDPCPQITSTSARCVRTVLGQRRCGFPRTHPRIGMPRVVHVHISQDLAFLSARWPRRRVGAQVGTTGGNTNFFLRIPSDRTSASQP